MFFQACLLNAEEINPKVEIEKYCEPEDLINPLEAHAPRVDAIAEDIQQMLSIYFWRLGNSYVWMKKVTLPIVFVFLRSIVAFICAIRAKQTKTPHMTIIASSLIWSGPHTGPGTTETKKDGSSSVT